MKKEIVFELLDHLYEFNKTKGETPYTFNEFVSYLRTQTEVNDIQMRQLAGEEEGILGEMAQQNDSEPAILITLLFRYAKRYIKKALTHSSLQTGEEFSFLITLMTYKSLTKTELINKLVMEKTSGVEVIKRLLSQNLIEEFNDTNDKRSVRVAITDKGQKEIFAVLPGMSDVSRLILGNLSKSEIKTLSYLLKKLDIFHNDIFMNKKSLTVQEILEESIKQ